MKIKEVIDYLEGIAPSYLQESYDNSGLIIGDANAKVTGVTVSLDCTEDVVKEAMAKGCNLIVAHHPIVFSGIKKLNGSSYIERTVILAVKNDIAIYAIHTNLDNVIDGVNGKMSDKLGMVNRSVLQPKSNIFKKLAVFCPIDHAEVVKQSMFNAGAGDMGDYAECSFTIDGTGTFKAQEGANPFVGEIGQRHAEKEVKIEVLVPEWKMNRVLQEMIKSHPYELVAHDIYNVNQKENSIGSGMIGELPKPIDVQSFLNLLKEVFSADGVRYTNPHVTQIRKVALCGGSGSFLLNDAIRKGADIFITGDMKYHQFFDADQRIIIADIGHFESEQFTVELLVDRLKEKFSNFAVRSTAVKTNPINYL